MDNLDEIKRALLAGDKIGAIRIYREKTKVGLAEAKHAVEQMQTQLQGFASAELRLPQPVPVPASLSQNSAITEALFAGKKIQAIQLYRAQTHTGLAEAKRAVEEIEKQLRLSAPGLFTAPASKGCLVSLCFFAAASVALWRLFA